MISFFDFSPASNVGLAYTFARSERGTPFFKGSWPTNAPKAWFANSHMIMSKVADARAWSNSPAGEGGIVAKVDAFGIE